MHTGADTCSPAFSAGLPADVWAAALPQSPLAGTAAQAAGASHAANGSEQQQQQQQQPQQHKELPPPLQLPDGQPLPIPLISPIVESATEPNGLPPP